MDVLLDWQHYHQLNISLLSVIGLWPYGNKFILRLKQIVGGFFALSSCVFQVATFFTVDYTTKLLLKNAPSIFVGSSALLKYISFLFAGDTIKRITETINSDWKSLSSREEIQIIEKYVERGRFYTKGFTIFICPLGTCLTLLSMSSIFLDIVKPLNESRSRDFPIMFEVFVNQKEHFFLAAFIYDGCLIVGSLVFVSSEALLIVYIQHSCALFEVTSHRIKKFMSTTETKDSKRRTNVVLIAQLVEIHCRAFRHCKAIRDDFIPSYAILLAFGILALGAHLFRCAQTFASNEYPEFFASAIFSIGILGYMFYLTFALQSILDMSVSIFDVLYDTAWCEFPPSTRKIVLFCMVNSLKPVEINICSVFTPSLEGLSLIVRMTVSYATALFSFQ